MSLLDVLRSGIAIADGITKPLQSTVTYRRWLSTDDYGTSVYATAVDLVAVVDASQSLIGTPLGEMAVAKSTLTFINIADVVAATEGAGFTEQDEFVLPDGTTGPVVSLSGFMDAGTGRRIYTEVRLG